MPSFQSTRVMNMVGTIGFAVLGLALFCNEFYDEPLGALAIIALICSFLVFVPAGTAHALSNDGRRNFQKIMLFANWLLIAFACIAAISPIFIHQPISLAMVVVTALLFVLPEVINIRALRMAIAANMAQAHRSLRRKVELA